MYKRTRNVAESRSIRIKKREGADILADHSETTYEGCGRLRLVS